MTTLPVNPLDNSESIAVNDKKDVYLASNTGTSGELTDAITYMKYLEMKAKLQSADGKSIKVGDQTVPIADLLPPTTEFDEERMRVLRLLVKLGPDDNIYKSLCVDFGCNSLFELSTEIANYSLARTRGEKIYGLLHGKTGSGKDDTVYHKLLAGDAAGRTALQNGTFTAGVKSGKRAL